ncbi:CHAT domain-containing protein [Spirulina sp. 06S082]|uniref:CHAT domain-containing protein n=1 Tax=Spirulina sp. 06S082 TaxID=3110248 RepID=UPI002B1FBF4B|nr:CHAT domain-containing protein [Spirulina sp. 06S082]MEA5469644.1 CHAT domain-containing protein [Spirulina sp. 06S082]
MSREQNPCLSLAVDRLLAAGKENYAIWVLHAPLPGGYVHHDSVWPARMTKQWLAWQEMFSLQEHLHVPLAGLPDEYISPQIAPEPFDTPTDPDIPAENYSGRLMQNLGIDLWNWLLQGSIRNSWSQSRGVAIGQNKPLRFRLDIRDPHLIPLPWEIIQPAPGKQSISLNRQFLFSRTTSDVDPLTPQRSQDRLNILLVLGESDLLNHQSLQLREEARSLSEAIEKRTEEVNYQRSFSPVPPRVDVLLQPTPAELVEALEKGIYNVFFYAGHGVPAPDGGSLFLRPDATINGTELAQVLVRTQIVLAVFNACWGAQPDRIEGSTIPRSSLAEVLIHHGVPAVLGMRDAIADREALSFIQVFTEALSDRMSIDRAVAIARQHLLTLYKFNQPAWTLPILYMHPEFEGELIKPLGEGITELPTVLPGGKKNVVPKASLHSQPGDRVWEIQGGLMRVGRRPDNDLVIQERWVSQNHAEIFYRETFLGTKSAPSYFLRDFSRYGTLLSDGENWKKVHHQEVLLESGVQLKFGSSQGQVLEFKIKASQQE